MAKQTLSALAASNQVQCCNLSEPLNVITVLAGLRIAFALLEQQENEQMLDQRAL